MSIQNKWFRSALVGLVALSSATSVFAQENAADSTNNNAPAPQADPVQKEDVDGVSAALESFKFQYSRDRDLATAIPSRPLGLFSVVQLKGSWTDSKTLNATGNGRNNSLDIGAVILGYNSNIYKDYEQGKNVDFSLSLLATPGVSATPVNAPFALYDANISYTILQKTALEDPLLRLTLGQQTVPFGLEAQTSDEFKPTIGAAQFVSQLGLGTHQLGLILRGDLFPAVDYGYNYRAATVEYALGVVNGQKSALPTSTVSDDNNAKDVIGRIALTAPADYNSIFREFKVGASYYKGWINLTANTPATPAKTIAVKDTAGKVTTITTAAAVPGTARFVEEGESNRYGFDVYYNHHPIGLTYEYVHGADDYVVAGGTTAKYETATRRSQGHVATVFFNWGEQFLRGYRLQGHYDDWWPKSFQPFARYDYFDPDIKIGRNQTTVTTTGLNIFFAQTAKVQFNYNWRTITSKVPTNALKTLQHRKDAAVQVQFGF